MEREVLKKNIFSYLKNIAPEQVPEKLKGNDNIRESLNIDSFDYLNFIVRIDESLGIETPEQDYGKIQTLDSLLDYLEDRLNENATNA